MNPFRTSSLVLIAVLAAGCSDPAGPDTGGSTTGEPTTMSAPSTEPTGPETPRSGDDGVAISLPQLPIGGGARPEGAQEQCVTVGWLSDVSLASGVKVTGVGFDKRGVFSAGGGCGEEAACVGFTFHANGDQCSVAVRALGTGGATRLTLSGKDLCSCRDIRGKVQPGSVPLTQPSGPGEPATDETGPDQTDSPTPETTATG
ncbi:Uncharacterised protein [Amycolatopsis camponoti]|uniref:Lipoprotein n=1 Tax=Amycolatopsis camponoti TaxID=2606593 RepID=A0A6I8LSD1_9PSEU|nr:hypothetical protein [Amycolatopsis camponoti]VVJ17989.1 Uncharacterised protein [Amycolatopsis camponoti]